MRNNFYYSKTVDLKMRGMGQFYNWWKYVSTINRERLKTAADFFASYIIFQGFSLKSNKAAAKKVEL
jgi:hypothetical protein